MNDMLQQRVLEFQRRISDEDIDVALIDDADNIYFLSPN